MDWSDLTSKLRKVGAPQVRCDAPQTAAFSGGDDLVSRLKAHEAEELARLRRSRGLFLAAVGFTAFTFVGVLSLQSEALYVPRILQQGVLLAAFVYITLALRKKLWSLSRVDYTLPVRAFLDEAEQRYVFMKPGDCLVMILGLALLGLGSAPCVLGLLVSRYVGSENRWTAAVLYALFYLVLCAMGFWFTRRDWMRDKAPLLADIRRMREALEKDADDEL